MDDFSESKGKFITLNSSYKIYILKAVNSKIPYWPRVETYFYTRTQSLKETKKQKTKKKTRSIVYIIDVKEVS